MENTGQGIGEGAVHYMTNEGSVASETTCSAVA